MLHQAVLEEHFERKDRKAWVTLKPKDGKLLLGFGTGRVAKVVDGHRFLFTVGETEKGKRNGLSPTLARSITDAGLCCRPEPTTDGQLRDEKLYPGFDLASCSPETLKRILKDAEAAIRECR